MSFSGKKHKGYSEKLDEPKGTVVFTGVIVTTFNRPDALKAVLATLAAQTVVPDQVIIADDGSQSDTRNVVASFSQYFEVVVCWQPNVDFRASRSRNLALARTTCEYVIFIDGDCLLPANFVESHLALRHSKKIIAGSRNLLSKVDTNFILDNLRESTPFCAPQTIKTTRLYLGVLRDLFAKQWKIVRTCNMSAYTTVLIEVGGFDEAYIGWGLEDSDLIVRLLHRDIRIRNARYAACVNHLFHIESSEKKQSKNQYRLSAVIAEKHKWTPEKSSLKQT